ncbi:MAG: hypothetical protein ABFE07_00305, partial [Armatimonadia bacterium]
MAHLIRIAAMIASRQGQKSESPREAGLLADQARAFMVVSPGWDGSWHSVDPKCICHDPGGQISVIIGPTSSTEWPNSEP